MKTDEEYAALEKELEAANRAREEAEATLATLRDAAKPLYERLSSSYDPDADDDTQLGNELYLFEQALAQIDAPKDPNLSEFQKLQYFSDYPHQPQTAQPSDTELCSDCPPVGYPTDETRCQSCPRKARRYGATEGVRDEDQLS